MKTSVFSKSSVAVGFDWHFGSHLVQLFPRVPKTRPSSVALRPAVTWLQAQPSLNAVTYCTHVTTLREHDGYFTGFLSYLESFCAICGFIDWLFVEKAAVQDVQFDQFSVRFWNILEIEPSTIVKTQNILGLVINLSGRLWSDIIFSSPVLLSRQNKTVHELMEAMGAMWSGQLSLAISSISRILFPVANGSMTVCLTYLRKELSKQDISHNTVCHNGKKNRYEIQIRHLVSTQMKV